MKYLIGSKLLGLSNAKDTDYMVISNEYDYKRIYENGEDVMHISEDHMLKCMNFNYDFKECAHFLILNYQYDADIIGQNFPIDYHLLDHRSKVIKLLKNIITNKLLNMNKRVSVKGEFCSKYMYHIAYNVFILQNNSPIITPEQKEIIQKLHDRTMPISFRDELINMIINLKEDTNNETSV